MKASSYIRLWVSALFLVPWLYGCATVPNSGVQTFATGVATAKSQTTTAFQAVTDVTSQTIIDFAANQPTLTDTNFLPVLDPKSLAVWDQVFFRVAEILPESCLADVAESDERIREFPGGPGHGSET